MMSLRKWQTTQDGPPNNLMKNLNPTIKKTDIIFSPESGLIIGELLEKYDLKKQEQEEINKFLNPIISPELKKDIFKKLPGTKISRLVRNYAEGKVSLKDLSLLLEKNLNIPKEKAKNLANELENKSKPDIYREPIE